MARFKTVMKGLGGALVLGGGSFIFYENMFMDRHAKVNQFLNH